MIDIDEETKQYLAQVDANHPEVGPIVRKILQDYPEYQKNVFIMMRFKSSAQFREITQSIRDGLKKYGLRGVRADDKAYSDDLWLNVRACILACNYGVAVFEDIDERDVNPNIAIEYGFMMALGKRVLLLKEERMPRLPTDITGRLWKPFSIFDAKTTITGQIDTWAKDIGLLPIEDEAPHRDDAPEMRRDTPPDIPGGEPPPQSVPVTKTLAPPPQGFRARLGVLARTITQRRGGRVAMGVGIGILVLLILGFSWRQMDAVSCTSTSYQDTIPTCWGCTCDKAFDGNSHSRWASAWDDNQSITLDFGKLVTIDHVVLKWEMAYGKAYTIDASSDGIRWTSVYTETQGDGGVDDVHFPLTMTRYVRMQGLGRGLELGGYSLWEFEAYQGNDISLLKYFQRIPKVCHPKDPSK